MLNNSLFHIFGTFILIIILFFIFTLGLGSILFAISIDNSDLNVFRPSPSDSSADTAKILTNNEELEPKPVISKNIENGNGNLFSCTKNIKLLIISTLLLLIIIQSIY